MAKEGHLGLAPYSQRNSTVDFSPYLLFEVLHTATEKLKELKDKDIH